MTKDSKMQTKVKLTAKQSDFVQYFCLGDTFNNATQSAIKAGYSKANAKQLATQTLSKLYVKQAISDYKAQLAAETGYTIHDAQTEYEQARQLAMDINQPAAASTAITGKARLFGMDKDAGSKEQVVIVIAPKPKVREITSHAVPELPEGEEGS